MVVMRVMTVTTAAKMFVAAFILKKTKFAMNAKGAAITVGANVADGTCLKSDS